MLDYTEMGKCTGNRYKTSEFSKEAKSKYFTSHSNLINYCIHYW